MSKNIVEISRSDSTSKDSPTKKEIIPEINTTNSKASPGTKKIVVISFLIFLILTLFISCAYLLSSKKAKVPLNLPEIRNEKRRIPIRDNDSVEKNTKISFQTFKYDNIDDAYNGSGPKITANIATKSYERKVLLITNYISKKRNGQNNISPDTLYNILKNMKKVTLTVLNAYDSTLNSKSLYYLKNYNLVVLDFIDGGFNLASRCPNFVKVLMQYVKEGGALFSCHDQFDDTHSRYITSVAIEMLQLLGFKHYNFHGTYSSTAYFDKTVIRNSFFTANQAIYGDSIPIALTHQTYSRVNESCTTCNVIMKLSATDSTNEDYLVTNRPGKGKTLNIRAGHTSGFTEQEKKIFLSSLLWLLYEE